MLPAQECPILRTEDRESQVYVTFRSRRAILVRFHRGLRESHIRSHTESVAERFLSATTNT